MNYLVTGGAGFIGSHLCERLINLGHSVICYDNFCDFYDPSIKRENISNLQKSKNFKLVEGDIRNFDILNDCMSDNIDFVIHLAAMAGVRPSILNPKLYYDVNVMGTLNLLEAMINNSMKNLLFSSSSSVYGNNLKTPFSENDPINEPISPYAATKRACEMMCYTYHKLYKLNICSLRLFTVYGPRQRPDLAINKFVTNILKGNTIQIYGDGTTKRDYTFVDDVVDAIILAIQSINGFSIYNIGCTTPISLGNLIYLIEKILNKNAIKKYTDNQQGDVDLTNADISKAVQELGYKPKVNIEKGLLKFITWKKKYLLNNK